ncbi:MAG: lysophospholipid acyltransferase family protein [Flavobacteriaceae bacterium]|nr:lysophospholipid acyltransferase family protein [Flavobacteriaceae bacterium]
MLKRIWYQLVKVYITTGLFFYHKKIKVGGKENIPKKGALLFVSNHKNALIDPLLIATTTTRNIHFLTRASAFKLKLVKWLLSTVNMLPIYRMRDGKETLAKNEEIFQKCYEILNKKRSLLIFPEGTHDIRRWVRPLSKGFTRITFGALEQNPNLELTIVPVGLNYAKAQDFAEPVSILYGKPIVVNDFLKEGMAPADAISLREEVRTRMMQLTTHIDDIENEEAVLQKLGHVDFLNPTDVNKRIENIRDQIPNPNTKIKRPSIIWKTAYNLVKLNSIVPLLIWKLFKPKIQEVEFVSTTRFAIGITAFPLFYILQSLMVNYFFTTKIALTYFGISIVFVLFLVKSK